MEFDSQPTIAAILVSAAAICLAACKTPAAGAARGLVVEAGNRARAGVPMSLELPGGANKASMTAAGKPVPCQVAEGRLWWILDELAAGARRTYAVELGAGGAAKPGGVELKQTTETIDAAIDGRPFTSYHFIAKKPGGPQLRRPYFFPVLGPGQTPMTRPYPLTTDVPKNVSTDHPHHTSIWVAYGKVNGTDNWSISPRAGWQLHRGFDAVVSGPVVGMFRERLDWTTSDRKPVAAEARTVRIYRLPQTARMIDLEVTFRAKYGKVAFGDTKEGGLCSVRMRPELRADKKGREGRLVNAQGLTAGGAWGKRSEWVHCSGLVGGKRLGFAIFGTPGNLRHPTYWHARTYGLLTANPFGISYFDRGSGKRGDHTLEAGKELTFRYRIYFHLGDEKEGKVAARYADYAQPPKATWK